jgi:hypothetical protein
MSSACMKQEIKGCRFLTEVVLDGGFLPGGLYSVLKDFLYVYRPRVHVAAVVCWRGGEVTVTLTHDSDAIYDACLGACARAVRARLSWVDAVDALDACRRECRGAVDELIKQDVETGVRLLSDLLKSAGVAHEVEAKTDIGAVLRIWL